MEYVTLTEAAELEGIKFETMLRKVNAHPGLLMKDEKIAVCCLSRRAIARYRLEKEATTKK